MSVAISAFSCLIPSADIRTSLSIGFQSEPRIGVQKGPLCAYRFEADVSLGEVSLFGGEAFLHPG